MRARLRAAGEADLAAWEQVAGAAAETVGESTFEIWLEPLELIAVDRDGTLIVSAPEATVSWVAQRFGRVLDGAAQRAGRPLRIADEVERKAAETLVPRRRATRRRRSAVCCRALRWTCQLGRRAARELTVSGSCLTGQVTPG